MRRAVLCDGAYLVPAAVHARLRDRVDVRAEPDRLSFAAASDVHGRPALHFDGRGRFAGLRDGRGLESIARSCRRILFRVAGRLSAAEFGKGRAAEFEALRADEHLNRGAADLRGRAGVDDFFLARGAVAGVDNGGLPVHLRRRAQGGGGGCPRREAAKNFFGARTLMG